jgi:D-glycero-beta-D-manno-heptose-7-phosphate kinase
MFEGFDFDSFFSQISNQKILIIGDVMIDSYLWGDVRRVSPEAPVPIVSGIMEESRLGGAANVALNVKAMGAVPILCSVIGGDERGSIFLELLEEQNLSDVGITVDDFRVTTQKTRVISGFKQLLRVDEEMDGLLPKAVQEKFIEIVLNLMESGGIDSIIIQDYDKGVISPSIITKLSGKANKLNIPVMVDPKFRNFKKYKNITLFKPNFKELMNGLKIELNKSEINAIVDSAEEFRKKQKLELLMVTLSSNGILILEEGNYHHIPAVKSDVTDVSGAGDTVISVASICYNSGMNAAQIAAVANLAGGQVCEKSGVIPVNRDQLLNDSRGLLIS